MKKLYSLFLLALFAATIISCDDDDDEGGQTGDIEIKFDNVVGEDDLELNTSDQPYTNAAGESYKVTMLRYYISNIKLKTSDGKTYTDEVTPDGSRGYYLIDESEVGSHRVTLEKVPAGDYSEITFTIGVDANQVTEGAQLGALDPAKGMFWDWNSGYIFMMFEGESEDSSDPYKAILYHVGGYKSDAAVPGLANNIRTKTLSTGHEPAMVRSNKTPKVHVIIDVNKFFDSPNEISFAETPVQYSPADNTKVADNYVNAFVVDHVHN